jgi:hypothetical protein
MPKKRTQSFFFLLGSSPEVVVSKKSLVGMHCSKNDDAAILKVEI